MSDQITYDDKADLIVDTTIDDMFKVSASDMNEIKEVVNANAQEMDDNKTEVQDDIAVINNNINDLNNNKLDINAVLNEASTDTDKPYSADYLNDKLVSVGVTAPTDGERVWLKKSKNLLDTNSMVMGDLRNETGEEVANTNLTHYRSGFIRVLPNTQYTFTTNYTFPSGGVTKLMEYADDKTFIQRSPSSSLNQVITFTTSNTTHYLRICMFSYVAFTDFYSLENMLSLGTATTYEQYIEPSIYVDEEELYSKPKVLYENSSGTSSDFTLNESIANYSYIEVEYQLNNYTTFKGRSKLIKNSTTSAIGSLSVVYGNGSNGLYFFGARLSITGTSATIDRNYGLNVATTGTTNQGTTIQVTRVLGYKE